MACLLMRRHDGCGVTIGVANRAGFEQHGARSQNELVRLGRMLRPQPLTWLRRRRRGSGGGGGGVRGWWGEHRVFPHCSDRCIPGTFCSSSLRPRLSECCALRVRRGVFRPGIRAATFHLFVPGRSAEHGGLCCPPEIALVHQIPARLCHFLLQQRRLILPVGVGIARRTHTRARRIALPHRWRRLQRGTRLSPNVYRVARC